jgi:serine/threonine protein phosphatase PrpC
MPQVEDFDTSEYPNEPLTHASDIVAPVRVAVELGAATHAGLVRPDNEDHFLVARLSRSLQTVMTNVPTKDLPNRADAHGYVMAVADGLGGHAAGGMASRLAIRTGLELVASASNWALRLDSQEAGRLVDRLRSYFVEIDRAFQHELGTRPDLSGMATTLTVAYTAGLQAFLVHVGDSRVYRYRSGTLEQLTRDHTVAQSLADSGLISAEELRRHPKRHVLTNVISGRQGEVRPDIATYSLRYGDRLLVSTDGLHDLVDDAEIAAILAAHPLAQTACDALVTAALDRGGRDNVTVIVAAYSDDNVVEKDDRSGEQAVAA